MNWFTGLFGSADQAGRVVEKATDAAIKGLDAIVYTREEQAGDVKEMSKAVMDFVGKTFDENSVRNITRRWLAWGIVAWILGNAQVAVIAAMIGHDDAVDKIIQIASAFQLGWAFVGVIGAYFGVQWLRTKK